MRATLTLVLGLVIGCLAIAGLGMFKNFVWAKAERWAAEQPPPQLTPGRRALLHAGNFVDSYWIPASLIVLPLSVGIAGVVAYRQARAKQRTRSLASQSSAGASSRYPFELAGSTVFIAVALLSLSLGLLLVWASGVSSHSTHFSPLAASGALLVGFLFPLTSLLGTLFALVLAVRRRRWQFVLELVLGVALLVFIEVLGAHFSAG